MLLVGSDKCVKSVHELPLRPIYLNIYTPLIHTNCDLYNVWLLMNFAPFLHTPFGNTFS